MTYIPTVWTDFALPCIDAAHLNAMERGIDIAQGDEMMLRGVAAARPASAADMVGRLYIATDTGIISRDNGGGWDNVAYGSDIYAALGDVLVGTGAGTAAPLGIGAGGDVLTVAGGTATWAAAAAGGAWTFIAETILGAPAASVTFAAIPGTYRDLMIHGMARSDENNVGGTALNLRFNADSGNNYDWIEFYTRSDGLEVNNDGDATNLIEIGYIENLLSYANSYAPFQIIIPRYADTDKLKWAQAQSARFGDRVAPIGAKLREYDNHGSWRSTATITSATVFPGVGNFVAPSVFTLYGIN